MEPLELSTVEQAADHLRIDPGPDIASALKAARELVTVDVDLTADETADPPEALHRAAMLLAVMLWQRAQTVAGVDESYTGGTGQQMMYDTAVRDLMRPWLRSRVGSAPLTPTRPLVRDL